MKVEYGKKRLTLVCENKDEETVLIFINNLTKRGALLDLVCTFADMINKDILRVHNGKLIWNSEWTLVEEIPGYG